MAEVIPFPLAPSFRCRLVHRAELEEIQQILRDTLEECPACKGRGSFLHKVSGSRFGVSRCPCGGDDENRVDLDGPDYPGAA